MIKSIIILKKIEVSLFRTFYFVLSKILPSIRVHCWGGLGSQLFALNLMFELREKYPYRKLKLVQHNGGVTKRENELNFIKNRFFSFKTINDYNKHNNINSNSNENLISYTYIQVLRKKILKYLYMAGFFANCNTDSEFKKLKLWIVWIRGHYLIRKISLDFIKYLNNELDLDSDLNINAIAVHYRLGDMIHLGKKFDPSVDRTINIISKLYSEFGEREIHLFSDSIDQAKINFKNHEFFGRILKLKCYELSTIESIRKCVYADFFIGTESKISLWIVNLRNFKGKEKKTHFEYFKDLLYTS